MDASLTGASPPKE